MPPKCTTGRQFPAIQSKGCTLDGMTKAEAARAKAKAAPVAKAAPAQAPVIDVQRLKNKTYQVALQIKAKRNALEQADRVIEGLRKVNDIPLIRLQRNATRNIQLIREELEALKINKRVNKALSRTNAAATRANIIRRIKGARGRKHMAVH